MDTASIVRLLFAPAEAVFWALAAANLAILVAKLSHHERVAEKISRTASRLTWPLRLGGGTVEVHKGRAR